MLAIAPSLCAQISKYEYGGYLKYLFSYTDPEFGNSLNDHLLHARLNTRWYATSALTTALELRVRAFYGESVESIPNFLEAIRSQRQFAQLDAVLWNERKSVGYGEIDRLWADWTHNHLQMTLGRQRIAWGTNLVWNPTDIFNPYSVLDFDYEERPAIDGMRLQYYTSAFSKLEVAAAPAQTSRAVIMAAQATANRWGYDFHMMAGRRFDHWLAGTSWAGNIRGGGFRGEVLLQQIPQISWDGFGQIHETGETEWRSSSALSGDYTFPSSLYLHTEVLYNSKGRTSNAALFRGAAQALGLFSPARWSWYQEISYNLSPLTRVSSFVIFNPDDHSSVLVPSFTWSAATDVDLLFTGFLFHGDPLTEYGGLGKSLFVRAKWSF